MICIYKITSPTNKVYIGQTVNYNKRIIHYRNLHFNKQKKLYASVIKHGWNNHIIEVLEVCTIDMLNKRERFYQDLYNVTGLNGLNIRLTKTNDKSGSLSIESKNKISIANKGARNGMYGKKIKESSKIKQRLRLSGEKNYLSKPIINLETGIFYECLREASFSINMEKRTLWINICKNKKNKTSFKYA